MLLSQLFSNGSGLIIAEESIAAGATVDIEEKGWSAGLELYVCGSGSGELAAVVVGSKTRVWVLRASVRSETV